MFEFLDASSEDITPIVLGIGSVGCKIIDSMFNDNGLQDRDVRRIYVHSSYEIIKKYTTSNNESILIRDHAHFLEKEIVNKLEGADVVFLVSGLGGETGSQISPYIAKEGANKRGNSSRLTQSFHFFMFEPIFSPVNALNQPI